MEAIELTPKINDTYNILHVFYIYYLIILFKYTILFLFFWRVLKGILLYRRVAVLKRLRTTDLGFIDSVVIKTNINEYIVYDH